MKRQIVVLIALTALNVACSDRSRPSSSPEEAPVESAWVQPPHIDGVTRDGAALVVKGMAGPDARVVLRGADGAAIAAAADKAGRFELRLSGLSGDVLLRPEVQTGEDVSVSPETLVVIQGGGGPVALVAPGQPTIRLDGHGVLDAVDFDGKALSASGRAAGGLPDVTIGGVRARVVAAGGNEWRALSPDASASSLVIGGKAFDLPDMNGASYAIERAGAGWRLTLPTPPQGRQTTWLPDTGR